MAIAFIAAVSRTYLLTVNDLRIREDEHHARFLRLVEKREPGTALITVSGWESGGLGGCVCMCVTRV